MSSKKIALVATLDTKGPEALYIKELIEARGHKVMTIDIGCWKEPPFVPDVTCDEVSKAGGAAISETRSKPPTEALKVMTSGATRIVKELFDTGKISGIISMGGGMGSGVGAAVMRELPVGVPKLMISTKVAQVGAEWYVGSKDVTLMPSVVDIAGLNRITRTILANAAGAIAGMVETAAAVETTEDKPLVLMSMSGVSTECGLHVKSALESEGYEVIVFHTTGTGGKALEEYISSSEPVAVIEIAMNEIGNYLFGGLASSGPDRLTSAGKKGVPQVITCGCTDYINFIGLSSIPEKYKDRRIYVHNPQAIGMRLNSEESKILAQSIAEKLNNASGPVKVLIPTRGFSSLSKENGVFPDPEIDKVFIQVLRHDLKKEIESEEVNGNINDLQFSETVIRAFHDVKQLPVRTLSS